MGIDKVFVKAKLQNDPAWARRALVVLHDRQTADEKASQSTSHLNGRGFNSRDAKILSSYATQVRGGSLLSPRQLEVAHKLLPKYAKQILEEIQAKQAE